MNNLMIDLETMGTSSTAPILSIGACYFEPLTGQIGATFHQKINLSSSISLGMVPDASTICWWMGQSDEAKSVFKNNSKAPSLHNVSSDFYHFADTHNCKPWGNGATFDITILESSFAACTIAPPWKFYNVRDVRTIVELGEQIGIDPKRDIPFEGVKHDALADAIHQAKYVSAIWQALVSPYAAM